MYLKHLPQELYYLYIIVYRRFAFLFIHLIELGLKREYERISKTCKNDAFRAILPFLSSFPILQTGVLSYSMTIECEIAQIPFAIVAYAEDEGINITLTSKNIYLVNHRRLKINHNCPRKSYYIDLFMYFLLLTLRRVGGPIRPSSSIFENYSS